MKALLIGGPPELRGKRRDVPDEPRVEIVIRETLTERPRWSFGHDLTRTEREVAVYLRSNVEGVYVLDGYEPTPDDELMVSRLSLPERIV